MIRATTPDGGHVGVDAWPRTVAPGATVSLDVASTHLPHCAVGAAALVEGPVELRREANKFGKKTGRWKGTGGVSFAVHDAAGAQCGYVANADMELVAEPSDDAPVAARVVAAGGGKWTLVAPETLVEDAVIDEAWTRAAASVSTAATVSDEPASRPRRRHDLRTIRVAAAATSRLAND